MCRDILKNLNHLCFFAYDQRKYFSYILFFKVHLFSQHKKMLLSVFCFFFYVVHSTTRKKETERKIICIYKIILSAILFDMNFVIGEQKFAAANDFCIFFWYQEFDTNFPTCQSQGHTLIFPFSIFLFGVPYQGYELSHMDINTSDMSSIILILQTH